MNLFTEIDRITRELYKEEKDTLPLGNYSVWVGGCEEHSYLDYHQAISLKKEYLEDGYDDVEIDTYEEGQ